MALAAFAGGGLCRQSCGRSLCQGGHAGHYSGGSHKLRVQTSAECKIHAHATSRYKVMLPAKEVSELPERLQRACCRSQCYVHLRHLLERSGWVKRMGENLAFLSSWQWRWLVLKAGFASVCCPSAQALTPSAEQGRALKAVQCKQHATAVGKRLRTNNLACQTKPTQCILQIPQYNPNIYPIII